MKMNTRERDPGLKSICGSCIGESSNAFVGVLNLFKTVCIEN